MIFLIYIQPVTIFMILSLLIFFTSSIPVFSSVSLSLSKRVSKPAKMVSVLFCRAHVTKGKPNFSLYLHKNNEIIETFDY